MKRLFLVRHAKSDWSAGMPDKQRPLNERGHRVAPRMAELLRDKGLIPDLMVSSPAVRAATTAKYFAEAFTYNTANLKIESAIYGATTGALMEVVNQLPDDKDAVMLFGHNPGFSYFATELSDGDYGNIPTCAVVCLEFDVDSWSGVTMGLGVDKYYFYPRQFDF